MWRIQVTIPEEEDQSVRAVSQLFSSHMSSIFTLRSLPSTLAMSHTLTIDDLKYDELRQILSYLSVRQLFVCRRVCRKWLELIGELLEANLVFSLLYNDISHYTNEGSTDWSLIVSL